MVKIYELIWSALKIALLSFGGGVSALPVIYAEYVTNREWFSDEEFQYFVTVSNALPGPIISQLIVMMGYNKRGISGAIASFVTITFTGPLLLIGLLTFLYEFIPLEIVQKLSQAVMPAVLALLVSFIWQQYQKSQKSLGFRWNWGLIAFAAMAFFVFDINIAIVFVSVVATILVVTPNQKRGEQQ